MIDHTQRQTLLNAARMAVAARLSGAPIDAARPADQALEQQRGVFVSVYVNGELRGCTGYIRPALGLIDAVISCAVSAATEDTRFEPLVAGELAEASLEISVLDPQRAIDDPLTLELGSDGIIVTGSNRTGLLLPQVAVKHGMTTEEFLDAGCRKADLPVGHWRNGKARVEVFSAEVFSDSPEPGPS